MQGQKPHTQELCLPSNLPVGELRRTVAEWLATPPEFVRLFGGVSGIHLFQCQPLLHQQLSGILLLPMGSNCCSPQPSPHPHPCLHVLLPPFCQGREFDSDCQTLADSRAGRQLIMSQINQKANNFSDRNAAAAQAAAAATEALMQQASSDMSPGCHIECLQHVDHATCAVHAMLYSWIHHLLPCLTCLRSRRCTAWRSP